jgi:hypothetical protein
MLRQRRDPARKRTATMERRLQKKKPASSHFLNPAISPVGVRISEVPEASEPAVVRKTLGNSGHALLESRQFAKMKTGSELPRTSDLESVDDLSKIIGDE